MLKEQDNELLTRVGPGTPMGQFMREYWVPALLSSELPQPDSDPVRVLLLGERLLAFRDTDGRIGLMDHACPHRGASLFFGRNEECGLRCVYHGWKWDVDGNCVDMPNEPAESNFRHKIKAKAYPTHERGGIVWTYMGPRAEPPPLPALAANIHESADEWAFATYQHANWLQVLEADIDTTHAGFLHYGTLEADDQPEGTFSEYQLRDRTARFEVIDTEGGAAYGARRPGAPGQEYWRVAQWCFPFYSFPPAGVLGIKDNNLCRVPMDDESTMSFRMYAGGRRGAGPDPSRPEFLPNTTDWYGRFRPTQNLENDFLIDRDVQRQGPKQRNGFTGIPVVQMQDAAMTTSMGLITDRSREHLGSTDAMVIRVRRRMLAALRSYMDDGTPPPGVDDPSAYQVRSGGIMLPIGADWVAETQDLRRASFQATDLDPAINGPL